jgi:glucose-6-phosphate 1-epimerase
MQSLVQGVTSSRLSHQEEVLGLEVIEIDNQFCQATIAYQGAQVLRYQLKNHYSKSQHSENQQQSVPILWLSEGNRFEQGKAIRGGIPLCFPWFGKHPVKADLPSHGFARQMDWQLQQASENAQGHHLTFMLRDNAATRLLWDYAFEAVMDIHLGAQLELNFRVNNIGKQSFEFGFAWHSYFQVPDIHRTQVFGLEGVPFLDQLHAAAGYSHVENQPIVFESETDRIYQQATGHYRIVCDTVYDGAAAIDIQAPDCRSVVVWNPWAEKAARLGDMPSDSWQHMLCVECGQLGEGNVHLAAGQSIAYRMCLSRK